MKGATYEREAGWVDFVDSGCIGRVFDVAGEI
jgi:hypothetical protein